MCHLQIDFVKQYSNLTTEIQNDTEMQTHKQTNKTNKQNKPTNNEQTISNILLKSIGL
jgi:hypothetical protein